jgi:hypothetical protein
MSKRLLFLENLIQSGKADAFARYAYALELKSLGRTEDALVAFAALRDAEPGYVPQYLMAGGVAQGIGRLEEARRWFDEGIARAQAAGDAHALSELRAARSVLD